MNRQTNLERFQSEPETFITFTLALWLQEVITSIIMIINQSIIHFCTYFLSLIIANQPALEALCFGLFGCYGDG